MKYFFVVVMCFVPSLSYANDGIISRIVNMTTNDVQISFVEETKIEKKLVHVCNGCFLKFEFRDYAVTYRKRVWVEKVPITQNVAKIVVLNKCVLMPQCVNGYNMMVTTNVQEQIIVNQPTIIGYTDKIIRCGIPYKVCEQPVCTTFAQ